MITDTDLKGHLIWVRSEISNLVFIADTGFPISLVNEKTANLLVSSAKSARRIKMKDDDEANRMVCYNEYQIPSLGRLIAPIKSGGWTTHTASFIVVDDRRANILRHNLLLQIGIQLRQKKPVGKLTLHVDNIKSSDTQIAIWVRTTYPGLCTRRGRSKIIWFILIFSKNSKRYNNEGDAFPSISKKKWETKFDH